MKVWKDLPKNSQDLFTRISRNQLNSAPRQNESDATRPNCREGCASDIKIRSALQQKSSCPKSNITTVSQNAAFDPVKTSSKFTKYSPATKNDFQTHLSFWPTPANVLATCRKYHACHADGKVSAPGTQNDVSDLQMSRKCRACDEKFT